MNAVVSPRGFELDSFADIALRNAARFWFVAVAIGQLIFVVYLLAHYGASGIKGDFMAWNKVVAKAYVPGNTAANLAFGAHVALAVVIFLGGLLQLVPQIRSRAPRFHRWNGRVYVVLGIATSLAGLYMVWFKGIQGDLSQHLGITLNAILIIVFAGFAIHHARARQLVTHRRWALRLFIVVSGVWFFRVAFALWLLIHQRPVGFDPKTFTGPFITFLSFANYLVPLIALELYLHAQDRGGAAARIGMAAGLIALTLTMAAGIFAATMIFWLPRI
jgi:uncharacterized membrane protein